MKLLCLALAAVLAAPYARAITFEQAVQQAANHSHEIKRLRLESESADLEKTKALAGYLPKLEVSGRHLFKEQFEELEVEFGGATVIMPAVQPYSVLGVSASWNLFDGFRTTNEYAAAGFKKQAVDQQLSRAQEQKRAEIRTLFYRALGLQVLVDVANQNIATLESHLNEVNSRIRSGVSTRYDALRVEVQLEDARTEKVSAEDGIAIARAKLFQAMNLADTGQPLEGKLPEDFSRVDAGKFKVDAAARTDREALLARRDEALKHAQAGRAHWMPNVSLFGNYETYNNINHSISESDQRFKNSYGVGLAFKWELYDGGADYARQRQLALASGIAEEELVRLEQSIPVDLEEARRRFSYDVLNYKAKLSSIRKAEEAVRLARGGLKAGTRTNTEVLDAVVDLNRAKAAAVKSQIDALEALGQLELSLGHAI